MNFVGTATPMQVGEIDKLAENLGVESAALRAVLTVESGVFGFDKSKRPKALFERHHFYKHLKGKPDVLQQAVNAGLAYPDWGEKPYPKGSDAVYAEIEAACNLDLDAALLSVSWGLGQIMGSNYKLVGCDSVQQMVEQAKESEIAQLKQMANFIKSTGLLDELQRKDWAAFAKGYNGPKYAVNGYDTKLAAAYEKYA